MEFIKFRDVEKTYKNGVNAVYDMNLEIKKGECIGQGIFLKFNTVDNDNAQNERTGGFGSTRK